VPPPSESPGRPAEFLLVERDRADVRLTREALRAAKVVNRLSVANDGEAALHRLRLEGSHAGQPRIDLVLLDLNLPRLDGREVLRLIKTDPDLARIVVLVLTNSDAEIEVLRSFTPLADGYVAKPVSFERIRAAVASIEALGVALVARQG